ncbi:hypothetical protein GV791_13200 [Nocardia cyriacigeorgica]|uniref:Uncharacterized protein n=1 Tax=Nocardia cyriacigeorgica TaxID=135487 RepID=A0A6P1CLP2_9NOCA|nr:DUF6508 domain-containing protein [Nocardia cyriacigeorgica]MBF6287259.1 hypothetical protein [Nocardia cyriacigeorgica]NEW33511.1 hypothetical protein [Nocardia cyriacigeorgica]BDT86567.1 hypothetical protein FMUAM8_23310 [Nocardia cyriacigeorgica]
MAGWWRRRSDKNSWHFPPGYSRKEKARIIAQFAEFDRDRRQAEADALANPYRPDPSDDPAIEAALRAAPREAWERLWSAVDQLLVEDQASHGTMRFENTDGSLCMPHVDYSKSVDRVVESLYEVDAIVSFPWMKWKLRSVYPGGRGLEAAPVADAARVLTAVVRAERFNDGVILAALGDGTLQAALNRLRTWYEDQPA